MQRNDYYVYEWFIVETGEVFYVGKGCNNRCYQTNRRNKMFNDFYNTHNTDVRKVFTNLTEQEAFNKEIELIKHYRNNTSFRLTNQTDGGDGAYTLKYKSDEELKLIREKQRESMLGKHNGTKNPMYGNGYIRGNLSLKANGKINNPKDDYYIFYKSYDINDKEKHPKL